VITQILNYLALGFLFFIGKLPLCLSNALGAGLGWFAFQLPIERKKVVLINLAMCFPHLSEEDRYVIAKNHFKLLGKSITERGKLWLGSEKEVAAFVQVKSEIDVCDGKPRVYVGMHMIGIEAGLIGLSIYLRDKNIVSPITLYITMKNKFFNERIKTWRERFGAKMLLRLHSTRELLREVRKGTFVLMSPDMDLGVQDSVFVPFFGVPTCTVTSISRMASLGHAEVCPVITTLNADGKSYTCHIGKAWANFPSDDVVADTARMNLFFEEQIIKDPAQYYWVHKRFKNRPEGEAKVY
jgi:KDO2-lipid IV(A) lauroyltransferase